MPHAFVGAGYFQSFWTLYGKAVFKDRAQLSETDPSNEFFRTDSMSVIETATIGDNSIKDFT
jgi:hypothetical protein